MSANNRRDLALWIVTVDGDVEEVDADADWDGIATVLVAATNADAAAALGDAYFRQRQDAGELAWDGERIAAVYAVDRETGLYR